MTQCASEAPKCARFISHCCITIPARIRPSANSALHIQDWSALHSSCIRAWHCQHLPLKPPNHLQYNTHVSNYDHESRSLKTSPLISLLACPASFSSSLKSRSFCEYAQPLQTSMLSSDVSPQITCGPPSTPLCPWCSG